MNRKLMVISLISQLVGMSLFTHTSAKIIGAVLWVAMFTLLVLDIARGRNTEDLENE